MLPKCCRRGHLLDGKNVYWAIDKTRPSGRRWQCRQCNRLRTVAKYELDRVRRAEARATRIEAWKREITPGDLAWAAGHFEGEGTISISASRREGYARPLASLASTDREVIALFSIWWPNSIAGKAPRRPSQNARLVYRWEINSATKVRAFIDQILPYIKTKRCREKFAVVSAFTDRVLDPHPGKIKKRYPEFIDMIRRLNRRGQIMLPSGETVLERITATRMLPAPADAGSEDGGRDG